MNRTITVNAIEPAPLSLRHPLGINLDLRVTMKAQNGTPIDPTTALPQFILLPRSRSGIYVYDMEVYDAANGVSRVGVSGTALTDRNGYNIELYLRALNEVPGDPPLPVQMAAKGVLRTEGAAYTAEGSLGLINVPVVIGPQGPPGVAGVAGEPGERGSIWFTGAGAPVSVSGAQSADMYLDETTGDVYRYDGTTWMRRAT